MTPTSVRSEQLIKWICSKSLQDAAIAFKLKSVILLQVSKIILRNWQQPFAMIKTSSSNTEQLLLKLTLVKDGQYRPNEETVPGERWQPDRFIWVNCEQVFIAFTLLSEI